MTCQLPRPTDSQMAEQRSSLKARSEDRRNSSGRLRHRPRFDHESSQDASAAAPIDCTAAATLVSSSLRRSAHRLCSSLEVLGNAHSPYFRCESTPRLPHASGFWCRHAGCKGTVGLARSARLTSRPAIDSEVACTVNAHPNESSFLRKRDNIPALLAKCSCKHLQGVVAFYYKL
jgi:hypothetical protein